MDGILYLTISDMKIELNTYTVQSDKVLVAGTCDLHGQRIAVAGALIQVRGEQSIQMLEE